MSLTISTDLRNARLQAVADFLDQGSGKARIQFYGTTRPGTGEDPGGSPLATVTLAKPCGAITGGILTLAQNDVSGDLIAVSGAALWARLINGNGTFAADGDVTDNTGSGEFKIAGTTGTALYAGGLLQIGSTALT